MKKKQTRRVNKPAKAKRARRQLPKQVEEPETFIDAEEQPAAEPGPRDEVETVA